MPKISVIVPVYKVEDLLCRCVDSILAQTYSDFELILVDDGSPDRSGEICDYYAERDHRVRVIHQENGGLSAARNTGISLACGEYLSFVDSDDMIHPQMLELLLHSLETHQADLVSTRYICFRDAVPEMSVLHKLGESVLTQNDYLDHLYPYHFEQIGVSAWGKLYKRHLFDTLRYPEGKIYEDLHIYLELLKLCSKIVVLDTPMYYYYLGNVSITKSSYLAHSRFDEFILRANHAVYFQEQGNLSQYQYAVNDYLTFFLRNAFAILLKYPERKAAFLPYLRKNRSMLFSILRNPRICRMRKVCTVLIHISPSIAKILAQQCIPDCLLEEMQ